MTGLAGRLVSLLSQWQSDRTPRENLGDLFNSVLAARIRAVVVLKIQCPGIAVDALLPARPIRNNVAAGLLALACLIGLSTALNYFERFMNIRAEAQLSSEDASDNGKRSLFRRLLDFVFGYDFFVSYSWSDGADYAAALAHRLETEGFAVFLDRTNYAAGDDWKTVGAWTLRRTGQLILVGSSAGRCVATWAELTIAALTMAIQRQKPLPGLIHHSDRGSQYAGADYRKVLSAAGMIQSMSVVAACAIAGSNPRLTNMSASCATACRFTRILTTIIRRSSPGVPRRSLSKLFVGCIPTIRSARFRLRVRARQARHRCHQRRSVTPGLGGRCTLLRRTWIRWLYRMSRLG